MEDRYIIALLEKYWAAETSLDEEAQLKAYFRRPEVTPELEPYRVLFASVDRAIMPFPGAGLSDERIMERIRSASTPIRTLYQKGWWSAAAAILILSVGIGLGRYGSEPAMPPQGTVETETAGVKDTYSDPAKAMATLQKALKIVSVRMNRGRAIAQTQMGKLSEDYHLAFRN